MVCDMAVTAEPVTVEDAILYLNGILHTDGDCIAELVSHRVVCNHAMAHHPTVQVMEKDGAFLVGLLGILNGLFGANDDGWGYISAYFGDGGELDHFKVTEPRGLMAPTAGSGTDAAVEL